MNLKFKKILLWIFIGLLSLGQLQRIELTGIYSGINFYFHDIFILLWLIIFVFTEDKNIVKAVKSLFNTNFLNKIITKFPFEVSLIAWSSLSILLNLIRYQDYISVLYLSRLLIYILFAISLRFSYLNKQINPEELRFKFFSSGLIILLFGFLQYIFIQDTRFLAILGWDDHFHRLISTIFDPGFTGIILVISFLFFKSLKKVNSNQLINFLISMIYFIGIALTFSRASYFVLVVSLIGLELSKLFFNSKKSHLNFSGAFLNIVIFFLIIFLIPKPGGEGVDLTRTSTIIERKSVIEKQFSSFTPTSILIGNGLFSKQNSLSRSNQTELYYQLIPSHSRMPDNLFINLLLSTGVLGTGLSLIVLFKWLIKIFKVDQEIGMAILTVLIHSQFSNSLLQPFVLLILLGGIASIKNKSRV